MAKKRTRRGKDACTLEELARHHVEEGSLQLVADFFRAIAFEGRIYTYRRTEQGTYAFAADAFGFVDDIKLRMEAARSFKSMLFPAPAKNINITQNVQKITLTGHLEDALSVAKKRMVEGWNERTLELGLESAPSSQEPGVRSSPLSFVDVQVSDHGGGDPEGAGQEPRMASGHDPEDVGGSRVRADGGGSVPGVADSDDESAVLDVPNQNHPTGWDDVT